MTIVDDMEKTCDVTYLEGLAQQGYAAYQASYPYQIPPWSELEELHRVAYAASAAAVVVAHEAASRSVGGIIVDPVDVSEGAPEPLALAFFKPRNHVDALAEAEYPLGKAPEETAAPGAAVRQLCRSLDDAPHLKRLLEDLLSAQNRASHEFTRERDERKRLSLITDVLSCVLGRVILGLPDMRVSAGQLLADLDSLDCTLSSKPSAKVEQLRAALTRWRA